MRRLLATCDYYSNVGQLRTSWSASQFALGDRTWGMHLPAELAQVQSAAAPGLHDPHYDFNYAPLATGASYWVTVARQQIPGKFGPCDGTLAVRAAPARS